MENINVPNEKVDEPTEEAHQPRCDDTMTSDQEPNKKRKRHTTFAENVNSPENDLSQKSSIYKEALSQPEAGLSHRQRLAWLQRRREPGLWAQCDACDAWRHLPHVLDMHQLPARWYCSMNPDKSMADCSIPEAPLHITDEEDLIHSEYAAGSLVWARLPGWPWWPAMVDDCPDTEQYYWLDGFSDIPTHYNVVFFDATEVTRAWISPEKLKPYAPNKTKFGTSLMNKYKKRIQKAIQQANDAEKLPLADRLVKYSFINKFKGPIVSPKKIAKRDLKKHQKRLQRKFNVEFPIDLIAESDDEMISAFRESNRRKNVIIVGTPKSSKEKKNHVSGEHNVNSTAHAQKSEVTNIIKNVDENIKSDNSKIEKVQSKAIDSTCEFSNNIFKEPDSMAIEIGSTQQQTLGSTELEGIDNDSSKTYIPEYENSQRALDFSVRVESSASEDFDF